MGGVEKSVMSKVQVIGDAREFIEQLNEKAEKALTKIGMLCETRAKDRAPVDTGLLRNSITYAIGGKSPAASSYADKNGGNAREYRGQADDDDPGTMSVIVGTGVEYAPYQELGHHTKNGGWVPPQAFLRPAIEGSFNEIKNILETELKPD